MTHSPLNPGSPQTMVGKSFDAPGAGHVKAEVVGDLSFDELRELPMSMQLGMDLSALD